MYEVEMVIKESIPTQWGLNSLHAVRNIGLNRIIGLPVGMGGGGFHALVLDVFVSVKTA